MTAYASTFSASVTHYGVSDTVLDDVQSVLITQGRANLSDNYRSGIMTIEGRVPSALPNIKIGDRLRIRIEAFNNFAPVVLPDYETDFYGYVADLVINYGIVPALDTWTITTEDAVAVLGRAVVTETVTAGTLAGDAAKQITDAAGVTMTLGGGASSSPTTVKDTVFDNANALDAFQGYANTEFCFLVQQGDELLWVPRQGWTNTGSIATFSDTDADPSYLKYQTLQVSNLADTVADEVVINIRGGDSVTSGTGQTYIDFQTYDVDNTQAGNLADYIKILFTNDEPVPYQLGYMLTGQDPDAVLEPCAQELRQVSLQFRGESSRAIVIGFSLSVTPDVARATLNLLPIQQIPVFTLDSTDSGILDTNVLSY